jgi:hypothetical protein
VTSLTVEKGRFSTFLSGFGPEVNDLRLSVRAFDIDGWVALPSHIIHRTVSATTTNSGALVISDVKKVLAFLKSLGAEANTISLDQPNGSPLRISCGKTSVTLPAIEYVRSSIAVEAASKIVLEAATDNWKSWRGMPLHTVGRVDVKELQSVKSMNKVLNKKEPLFVVNVDPSSEEFTVRAGERGETQMFVTAKLDMGDGPDCKIAFGPWFSSLIDTIPSGSVEIYTANEVPLIMKHVDREYLMIIVDKVMD